MNQHGEILYHTQLREVFNLICYIQHLMDETEDQHENPLSEENWMKQNNWKFIKCVIHHTHPMTPEQLKQKPFKEISKNQHEKLIEIKGSQLKRKTNPPHPQISQNKILNLIQLLKMKRNQITENDTQLTFKAPC